MSLKNTKSYENLQKALAGESMARNKYTYFAQAAKANGDDEIAAAFEQMAKNEMMHAKFWFEQLYGKPTNTQECLMQAAQGEYDEWHDMYPEFAQQAREDGLEDLAVMFEKVAAIERSHEKRFMTLLAKMSQSTAPTPNTPAAETAAPKAAARPVPQKKRHGYRCQFCGAIFDDHQDVCDTCGAIGACEFIEYYE